MTNEEYVQHANTLLDYGRRELDKFSESEDLKSLPPELRHKMSRMFAQIILSNIHYEIHDLNRSIIE